MSTMEFDFAGAGASKQGVKRPRPVKSCLECRKRKLKCDRLPLCSQCEKSHRQCKYSSELGAGELSDGSDVETTERPIKKSQSVLGALLQNEPVAVAAPQAPANGAAPVQHDPSGLGTMEDMAARLERLEKLVMDKNTPSAESSSSRRGATTIGNITASPTTMRSLTVKGGLRTRFFGQNSTRVLLNLFSEAKDFMRQMAMTDGVRDLFVNLQDIYKNLQTEHRKALEPLTVFVDSMMPIQKRMADILPKRSVCDKLLEAYLSASEGLYRVVHIPSFRQEYMLYWEGKGCGEGFLPRLLCMLSIASRSEKDSGGLIPYHQDSIHAPTACALVRHWLDGLRGKQLVDIHALQTEVLALHAFRMLTPRHQDSWTQLGFIVRLAQSMGLHRDPDEFPQLNPFSGEIRRRLWYTISDMDLHVALACNLPCAVREGEYTCKPPRNINDDELYPDMKVLPEGRPLDQYTTTQIQVCAANTLPYRIRVASIVSRLDTIRGYDEVLDLGAKLEQILDDINSLFPRHQALDTAQKFKEWRMRALLDMHVRRSLLALYRPFALGTTDCPTRIAASYLKSSITMLTYMDELDERMPGYADVFHMYHLVLKHDIIQAAFSVCYYIKNASETGRAGAQWSSGSWQSTDDLFKNTFESRALWSAAGMSRTIEKTLEALIVLIKDSSSDLKDVVALCIVLNSVQAGTPEQKLERIKAGVNRILEVCLDALRLNAAMMASMPGHPIGPIQPERIPDIYNDNSNVPFINEMYTPAEVSDEFRLWEFDFWNPEAMDIL